MKTFNMTLGLDMKIVVPQKFIEEMREEARKEETSDFLQVAQSTHPEDDEQFTLFILKNGVRKHTRQFLAGMFEASGIGCTLSPASLAVVDRSPPVGVEAVLPTEIALVVQG